MAIFNRYPYTSFQELNLDWILQELKDLTDEWVTFESQYQGITATAQTVPYGSGASVIVSGGSGVPFNFDFDIPAGKDLKLVSTIIKYGTSADTSTVPNTWYDTIPTITQGDYLWTRVTLNFNDGTQSTFYSVARNGLDGLGSVVTVNNVSPDGNGNVDLPLPQPSNSTPLMDTQYGSEGVSSDYSRADHQHLSDTSKLDIQNGQQAGDLNAYVVQDVSTQTIKPIASTPTANALVMYTANGTLAVNEPQTVYEAPRLLDVQNGFVSNSDISNYVAKTDKATSSTLGIVQPDNSTIFVDSDGILSAVTSGSLTVDELWTNASPSSSFSAQTIAMDLTGYEMVLITYKSQTSTSSQASMLCIKDELANLMFAGGSNRYRGCTPSDSGVDFAAGTKYATYGGSSATDNTYVIPLGIYGIK